MKTVSEQYSHILEWSLYRGVWIYFNVEFGLSMVHIVCNTPAYVFIPPVWWSITSSWSLSWVMVTSPASAAGRRKEAASVVVAGSLHHCEVGRSVSAAGTVIPASNLVCARYLYTRTHTSFPGKSQHCAVYTMLTLMNVEFSASISYFTLLSHDQDTEKGCVKMCNFCMAALIFLTGHGIIARSHGHVLIAHFQTWCIIRTWKTLGLCPCAS